ncbi:hypothetical protein JMM81_08095 [Bacillus sp. V3B]|uniref:hypothetical protein n=1 Tax=Bacillus sp. V3B TaxID=2804915 RepID=UPI00210A8C77|nr:hypothetical protein [Bacillus sp. V3B]MCQ6274923.1 hypothetical protein [Bacillus sp. V3B]
MEYEIETIYYLENPETEQITFATGSQLKYDDIIKDVFGVASIHDLPMMIQYNKGFQSCICKNHGVMENEITLEMILRIASKVDLLQLEKQYIENQSIPSQENSSMPCPFDSTIKLQEGIFQWNDKDSTYNIVRTS